VSFIGAALTLSLIPVPKTECRRERTLWILILRSFVLFPEFAEPILSLFEIFMQTFRQLARPAEVCGHPRSLVNLRVECTGWIFLFARPLFFKCHFCTLKAADEWHRHRLVVPT
jgi:hypothetical protein